jgi:hypothetical protein
MIKLSIPSMKSPILYSVYIPFMEHRKNRYIIANQKALNRVMEHFYLLKIKNKKYIHIISIIIPFEAGKKEVPHFMLQHVCVIP